MSTPIVTAPITMEQFMKMDLPEGREWELHGGEVVDMGQPSLRHRDLQQRIRDLLVQLFPGRDALTEYPFQMGDDEVRSADVGMTSRERRKQSKLVLKGAPEIVVEVLSPSDTLAWLKEYRRLCFAHGAQVFLTVDPDDCTVEVHLKGKKSSMVFGAGEQFQIETFGMAATLAVDEIFADSGATEL
jgi:Uma2 family endonuclease